MRGVGSAIVRLATIFHLSSNASRTDMLDLERIVLIIGHLSSLCQADRMVNYKTQTPPPGRTREWYRESWTLMLDNGAERYLTSRNYLLAAGIFTANTNFWPSRLMLSRFPPWGPGNLNSTFGALA